MFTLTLSGLIGLPSWSVPCASEVKSAPFASYVMVRLLGGGPGMNFDFVRFIFHVPMRGSLCAAATDASTATRHTARTIGKLRTTTVGSLTDFISPFLSRVSKPRKGKVLHSLPLAA